MEMSHDHRYFKYDKSAVLKFQSRPVKSNRITIIFVLTFGGRPPRIVRDPDDETPITRA